MSILIAAEGVVITLLVILVIGLLRSHGEILRALRDLGVELDGGYSSSTAPAVPARTSSRSDATDVQGVTPDGNERAIGLVGTSHSTLLAFLSSGCLTCADFWESMQDPGKLRVPGVDTRLVIVTKGPEAESPAAVQKLAPREVPVVMSSSAWDGYGIPVTPYFVLVDGPSGQIAGEGAAASWAQMEGLLARAVADSGMIEGGRVQRRFGNTRARGEAVDDALANAGITPGHPSLHPDAEGDSDLFAEDET